ncbi:hypothetical protein TKK_0018204 [Trichogramma kaykai]
MLKDAQVRGEEAPPPPQIEGRGDPPPSLEPNIRRAPPEQEPFALRQPNEQDLPLQQLDLPLVDQAIAPQQDLPQNNLQQPDFPLVDQDIAPQQDLSQNNLQQPDFPLVDQPLNNLQQPALQPDEGRGQLETTSTVPHTTNQERHNWSGRDDAGSDALVHLNATKGIHPASRIFDKSLHH